MKKLFVILSITILSVSAINAQFTKIGGGLGFTTGFPFHQQTWAYNQSSKFDAFVKGIYEITLPIHVSPSFTYFMPHVYKSSPTSQEELKYTVTAMMFDINGHYVFNSLKKVEIYGLAGLDIMLAKKKEVMTMPGFKDTTKEHDNAIGLNIGAGSYIKLTEQLDLFVEAKYLVSKYDQFMLNAGIFLNVQWLSKNENPGI